MATYDPEGQAKKAKYEKVLKQALPKRAFDTFGRELDPRSGKVLTTEELLDDLLTDPLEDLYALYESEMNVLPKPDLQDGPAPGYESPHKGMFEHPVTKQKNEIDALIAQGMDPTMAHQSVHGDVNLGDIDSKANFAATLGRLQDDGNRNAVKMEPEKQSILYRDSQYEKMQDAVTQDDLRTPMNQQVPDEDQTPADQVAEESEECYNYMDDVKYLQTYGRA